MLNLILLLWLQRNSYSPSEFIYTGYLTLYSKTSSRLHQMPVHQRYREKHEIIYRIRSIFIRYNAL